MASLTSQWWWCRTGLQPHEDLGVIVRFRAKAEFLFELGVNLTGSLRVWMLGAVVAAFGWTCGNTNLVEATMNNIDLNANACVCAVGVLLQRTGGLVVSPDSDKR